MPTPRGSKWCSSLARMGTGLVACSADQVSRLLSDRRAVKAIAAAFVPLEFLERCAELFSCLLLRPPSKLAQFRKSSPDVVDQAIGLRTHDRKVHRRRLVKNHATMYEIHHGLATRRARHLLARLLVSVEQCSGDRSGRGTRAHIPGNAGNYEFGNGDHTADNPARGDEVGGH